MGRTATAFVMLVAVGGCVGRTTRGRPPFKCGRRANLPRLRLATPPGVNRISSRFHDETPASPTNCGNGTKYTADAAGRYSGQPESIARA